MPTATETQSQSWRELYIRPNRSVKRNRRESARGWAAARFRRWRPVRARVPSTPTAADIVATGPLTPTDLSAAASALVGRDQLYFYDAISPIVLAESIGTSRSGRRAGGGTHPRPWRPVRPAAATTDRATILNCPMKAGSTAISTRPCARPSSRPRTPSNQGRFFEGFLPIEVMGTAGRTPCGSPMKPVRLADPRNGGGRSQVVQLRQDTLAGDHFSLVGFWTQLKWASRSGSFS